MEIINIPRHTESAFERFVRENQNNPLTRIIVALTGATSLGLTPIADEILKNILQSRAENNKRFFFDELAAGEYKITDDDLNHNNTLHAIVCTMEAVSGENSERKIHRLANLLRGATNKNLAGTELYDEYLTILRDLGDREIDILVYLWRHQATQAIDPNLGRLSEPQVRNSIWPPFLQDCKENLGVTPSVVTSLLERIKRTGFFTAMHTTNGDASGPKGYLNEYFEGFAEWVFDEDEDPTRRHRNEIARGVRFNTVE